MTTDIIEDRGLWDNFIEESPYGMLFHKWDFLKIIEKHTGYGLRTYGLFKGNELAGVCPIFYKRAAGVGLAYSPPQGTLAYIPYMGLVMSRFYDGLRPREKESCLIDTCRDLGHVLKQVSANYVAMTFPMKMNDIRPFLWDGYNVEIFYTYLIDLEKPLEDIWNGLDRKSKQAIKKCADSGYQISNVPNVDMFCSLMAKSLESQGNTFFQRQTPDYLRDLLTAFPDNLIMRFLYHDQDIMGMQLNCSYKGLYMGWCGGAVVQPGIDANEYFVWESIRSAREAGYRWYENWGGDIRRVNAFKSKFNPILKPYYHIYRMDAVGKLSDWGYDLITDNPYLGFVKNLI